MGRTLLDVFRIVDEKGVAIDSAGKAMREGFAVHLPPNTMLVTGDGRSVAVDDSASPIRDDRGNLLGVVVVFRDITERKTLEDRLAASERLALIGSMAAATAHEISNPLSYVMLNLGFATEEIARMQSEIGAARQSGGADGRLASIDSIAQQVRQVLDEALAGAERVHRIAHELRKFSHVDVAKKDSLVDLPGVLDASVRTTAGQMPPDVRVDKEYGTTPTSRRPWVR